MSMILDAMKRAKEGETQTTDVPTVDTVHYVPEPDPRFSTWQLGVMLIGGVLVIAVVLTAMWPSAPASRSSALSATPLAAPSAEVVKAPVPVSKTADQRAERPAVKQSNATRSAAAAVSPSNVRQQSSSDSSATQTPALQTNQDLTPAAAPASVPTPEQRKRPVLAKSSPPSARVTPQAVQSLTSQDELRAIYQALNEEASRDATLEESGLPSSVAVAGGAVGQMSNEVDIDGLARRGPDTLRGGAVRDDTVETAAVTANETPPIDFADILAAAQEELGVKPLVESSEPLLETLSQQIKDDIPSLIYSEHRYDTAGSSSVTLNGNTLKERQRVGGFTVIEILPDSVVLRWRETLFRVRARNSWINM